MSERNVAFLAEMGLAPRWVLREGAGDAMPAEDAAPEAAAVDAAAHAPAEPVVTAPEIVIQARVAEAPAPERVHFAVSPPPAGQGAGQAALPANMNWDQLEQAILQQAGSEQFAAAGPAVPGSGDRKASWLFIGAAPNVEDVAAGLPLAGVRGHLFANMLAAMGLQADQNVYTSLLLKSRPAQDAVGAADIAAWLPYLEREIALLQPAVIVALGAEVAGALLALDAASLSALRGTVHRYAGLPLVVTYDPADLVRTPAAKAGAWADLCLAMASHAERS